VGDATGAEVADWGNVAVLPGTVNAHGHAFQNLFKGFADDRPFDDWRDAILYPFSERLDGEAIYTGALFAFAEAVLAGVTSTVDFFYLHDEGNENARHVLRAARDVGLRVVFARTFYDPDAPTKAPQRYREEPQRAAERCLELAAEYVEDPLVSIQPAPHSLHAASPETIALALDTAERLDVPCHLHLAEARYEREQVRERYGTTPVRLLHKEGLLGPRLVTIHTVWVDDEEMDMLAESGAGVVHCPGANAFLGDGIARVPEMLARGIRVALGPDGGCANNRQSVFDEMRMATLVAKARLEDGSAMDAPTALKLGTEGGADLLGLNVGRIATVTKAWDRP
jgi:5-methylthioadenosine/S-adenosylhomocysteine deaminase